MGQHQDRALFTILKPVLTNCENMVTMLNDFENVNLKYPLLPNMISMELTINV